MTQNALNNFLPSNHSESNHIQNKTHKVENKKNVNKERYLSLCPKPHAMLNAKKDAFYVEDRCKEEKAFPFPQCIPDALMSLFIRPSVFVLNPLVNIPPVYHQSCQCRTIMLSLPSRVQEVGKVTQRFHQPCQIAAIISVETQT